MIVKDTFPNEVKGYLETIKAPLMNPLLFYLLSLGRFQRGKGKVQ
jgi:hypothetical protein